MGILSDFGYEEEDNTSYSPNEQPTEVQQAGVDLPTAIIQTAKQIGINPVDLATAISYETGGTFNPRLLGPQTKNGQGRGIGLIQFMSNGAAKDYGVTQDSSIGDQLKAAARYLVDRGVKPGMGLLDVYSAINAGRVGLYNRSDAGNGGAPGTVRDKVENQMAGHKIKAAKLLGFQKFDIPEGVEAAPVPDVPGYVPRTGPRRQGSRPGLGYIVDEDGGYRLAYDEPPTAMLYGPPRDHTKARADYIRSGIPGVQAQYVPPEMRGPFRARPKALPITTGTGTIGAPTTGQVFDSNSYAPAPGLPLDEAAPIDEQLAALLSKPIQTEPSINLMDESAGLNLSRTAPNISIPSQSGAPLPVPENTIKPQDLVPQAAPPPTFQVPTAAAVPPSVPISTDNMPDLPRTETVRAQPEPTSFEDILDAAAGVGKDTLAGARQVGAKVAGNITGYPFELAAAVRAAVPSLSGIDTKASALSLFNEGQKMRSGSDAQFGVSPTGDTLFQKAMALTGRNLTPMGAQTGAATGLMMAADAASQFIGTANAKPLLTKDEVEKLFFPGIGNDQIGPQKPPRWVPTAAGPAKLDEPNFFLLKAMGIATIGALLVPEVAKRMIRTRLGREISNVPDGVEAFSNKMDLLHTSHDSKVGLLRISRGMGVNPTVLNDMQTRFDFETGSSVQNYSNAAINHGEMRSPNFSYKVNTPLVKLAQAETEDVTRYMHLWQIWDEIREIDRKVLLKTPQSAYNGNASMPSPGPTVVRGMNKSQVRMAILDMEIHPETGPVVQAWRKEYQQHQKAVRDFAYKGEYGIRSPTLYKEDAKRRPNVIHQKELDIENVDVGMPRVSESFSEMQQKIMRLRMENEAVGTYVDRMVAQDPRFAKQVSREAFNKNRKSWERNTVRFYRRGKEEFWVTDRFVKDVLTLDPYMTKNVLVNALDGTRRFAEMTTTGKLAPQFALTNMQRNYFLAKLSPERGFVSPTLYGTAAAIPQQLYPQMAKLFSDKFEQWSGGWFGRALGPQGPQFLQGWSTKLAQVYDQSMYMQLSKQGGVHTSMFLDYNKEASDAIGRASETILKGPAKSFFVGLKNIFDAAHNAPNYAYAVRNIKKGKSLGEAARSAKQLTGDPQKRGRFYNSNGDPIGFDEGVNAGRISKLGTRAVNAVGAFSEGGRVASPWWNATTQGMKRVGRAYLDNPGKFVTRSYLYSIMPAAAIYMYTRGLGADPNGVSYVDYAMNRRSAYNSYMTIYIPIHGRPAEDGITIPLPHEIAAMWSMTAAAMHHATGSEFFTRVDDFTRAALSMVGQTWDPSDDVPVRSAEEDFFNTGTSFVMNGLIPAVPPVAGAILGSVGVVTPNGPFGGSFQRHDDGYAHEGMNTSFELMVRAMAPGLADIVGSGYAAFTHSPDTFSGLYNGTAASGTRAIQKAPLVRDLFGAGYKPPMAGSTQITDDMFGDKSTLGKLAKWYKDNDPDRDRSDRKLKGSADGRRVADLFLPEAPPSSRQGHRFVESKPAANALYQEFMTELDRKIYKDTLSVKGDGRVPSGGIGFPSHLARYAEFTDKIKELRKVGDSNIGTIKARIEADPELLDYLKRNKVPLDNPRVIKNFLETQRQVSARQILYTLKAIEQDFAQRLGDPNFKFDDLDPNQPRLLPPGFVHKPYVPEWPPYATAVGANVPKSHKKKKVGGTIQLPPQ